MKRADRSTNRAKDRGQHVVEQTQGRARRLVRGNDAYNVMVFPERDRWIWCVTFTSTCATDSAHWGRVLGCGDAPHARDAWNRARHLVDRYRTRAA